MPFAAHHSPTSLIRFGSRLLTGLETISTIPSFATPALLPASWPAAAPPPRAVRRCSTGASMALSTAVGAHAGANGGACDPQKTKQAVRKEIIRKLKALGQEAMASQNARITAHILSSRAFAAAATVGVYIHCPKLHEVDTLPILGAALQRGKRVYVPLVDDRNSNMRLLHIDTLDDLRPAPPFGILEPSVSYVNGELRENAMDMPRPLDLLLMPGLGFDDQGGRLGRGGGYYDKFVTSLEQRAANEGWKPPLLVALAFDEQIVEEGVPMESHDRPIDVVATPGGLHLCSEAARHAEAAGAAAAGAAGH